MEWEHLACVGLTAVFALSAACSRAAPDRDTESFEQGVPAHYTVDRPESLSLVPWPVRHGTNALRWDWKPGEALTIRRGIGDPARTGGFLNRAAFALCVYAEKPVPGDLLFSFLEGDRHTGSFRFPLSFSGWRQARLFYDAFPEGRPTAEVDRIQVSAPTGGVPGGAVFFDLIRYNTLLYWSAAIDPEQMARWRPPLLDDVRFPRPALLAELEEAGLQKLNGPRRKAGAGIPDDRVEALLGQIQALGLVRTADGVQGPTLSASCFYMASPGEYGGADVRGWPDEHGPDSLEIGRPGPDPVRRLADACAAAYAAGRDDAPRARLLDGFWLLADFLLDQGYALGLETVIAMSRELEATGRLEAHRDRLLRELMADRYFVGPEMAVEANMDFYASTGPYRLRNQLRLCFTQPDPLDQVRWLNAWKAMLERSLLQPDSPFKPDGSAYHHRGHYPSYAQNAFVNLPTLLRELVGTPWIPRAEALEPFRRAMLAQRIFCNWLDRPIALTGRSPFAGGVYDRIRPGYGELGYDAMARLHAQDDGTAVDREMAAAYLRLAPAATNTEPYRSLGLAPEPDPQGSFAMPYAAFLCHRRDNWLACVKGQSRYVWSSERQARRNAYGLFLGLGNLEILAGGDPVTARASGRLGAGWDWRRFEGVTAPLLPPAELDAGWPAVSGTLRSPERFAGGLSHQGRQGLFGMRLHLAIQPKPSVLRGRKSWFFEENRIVCLGSELSYDDPRHPVQTTLCQKALHADESGAFPPTQLDGATFDPVPGERPLDPGRAHWFLDLQRTGYYVPSGQAVTLARRFQKSRDVDDARDTEGHFLTAWIDHGKAPSGAGYEYALLIRTSPGAMAAFAAAPPYRVVRRDAAAHVVRFRDSGRWGFVFFEPQSAVATAEPGDGGAPVVRAVDRPCLVMAEPERGGRLLLTVADPDLNLENGVSRERTWTVTLRGEWRIDAVDARLCAWPLPDAAETVQTESPSAGETVLTVKSVHGASYGIALSRRGRNADPGLFAIPPTHADMSLREQRNRIN